MRRLNLSFVTVLLLTFAIALPFTSCENNTSTKEKMEEAAEDMKEGEIGDVFRTEQEELRHDLEEAKQKVDQRLAQLNQDLVEASEDARADIQEEIDELEKASNNLDQDLDRMEEVAEAEWANFKQNSRNTLRNIENEFEQVF